MEEVENRVSGISEQRQQAGSLRDWKDLSETEIFDLIRDQGVTDPNVLVRGVKELSRREAEAVMGKARKEQAVISKAQAALTRAQQRALSEFGPDVMRADSELRQEAGRLADEWQSNEGGRDVNIFEQNPFMFYLVFAEASRKLGARKATSAQQDNERLRGEAASRASGESSVMRASEASSDFKDALASNDWRKALRNLDTVRSLNARREPAPAQ
jgi:hypothetical protein